MAAVLEFRKVVKTFGAFTAVNKLSFAVPEGEVFGFLGANGAGKTTSLRMVMDILRPDSGEVTVFGERPGLANASRIGFLPEERGLYRGMTALDTVAYFGQLKGLSAGEAKSKGSALIERFGLSEWARKPVGKLSKGMAQKVQLACALVNSPKLLILDEPFSGLDPVNQGALEDTILELAKTGSTVVFSTHVMQHAERLSDRLLLLSRGKKAFEGTKAEAERLLPARVTITAKAEPKGLPGVEVVEASRPAEDGWISYDLVLKQGADAGDLLQACVAKGFALRQFEVRRPSLHDVFLQLVGEPKEKAA